MSNVDVASRQAAVLVSQVLETTRKKISEVSFVKAGDKVRHPKHGTGTVKYRIGGDEGVRIAMDKGGTKEVKFPVDDSDTGWRRFIKKSGKK